MAVCVFEGQYVVALGKRVEVCVVFEVLLGHVAVESLAAALICEEQIFWQSVGFVPGKGGVLVWAGTLFLARQSLLGQIGDDGAGEFLMNLHCQGILGKLVRINQPARELVIGVRRQSITRKEFRLRIERFSVAFYKTIDFRPRSFRSGDCVRPCKSRKILPKTVACDEAMKIIPLQAEAGQVVPASHVLTRRGQARNLPENLEQPVIVEVQETVMILVELLLHRTVE